MKKFAAVMLSLALALSLCACGGGGQAETKAPDADTESGTEPVAEAEETGGETAAETGIVGVYKLTGMVSDSEEDGEEDDPLAAMEAMGLKAFLAVQADGTAVLEMFGEQLPMKWDGSYFFDAEEDEDAAEADTDEEDEPLAYTYADGVLTMISDGDGSMTFTKLTEEELADYQENGSGSIEDLLNNLDLSSFLPDIPDGEPSDGPVSGEIDGCPVSVVGTDSFEEGGKNYIRFHIDFTNGKEETDSAFMVLYVNAVQDGEVLAGSFVEENAIPEDDGIWEDLEPGQYVRVTEIYEFNPDGGTVGIRLADEDGEDEIFYYADPQNLTGIPPVG